MPQALESLIGQVHGVDDDHARPEVPDFREILNGVAGRHAPLVRPRADGFEQLADRAAAGPEELELLVRLPEMHRQRRGPCLSSDLSK